MITLYFCIFISVLAYLIHLDFFYALFNLGYAKIFLNVQNNYDVHDGATVSSGFCLFKYSADDFEFEGLPGLPRRKKQYWRGGVGRDNILYWILFPFCLSDELLEFVFPNH